MRRRDALVALVERACDGSVLGRKHIAVLGAAFKPEKRRRARLPSARGRRPTVIERGARFSVRP